MLRKVEQYKHSSRSLPLECMFHCEETDDKKAVSVKVLSHCDCAVKVINTPVG